MLLKTFVFILSSPHVTVKLGLIYAGITDCPYGDCSIFGDDPLFTSVAPDA